ncbi:hypothetical protein NG791_00145 [Laspinema sp. D1]|uniref:hypothetical protein n=1 Tax=Laspinema palackyanum TaxID=3231601 RepID=UPI003472907B|nr:hypothetical protein [Laspinema sp. D2b]
MEIQEAIACSVPSKAPSPYQGKFFTLMVISLIINYTSGPLPLPRGGLGWGSSSAIATSSLVINYTSLRSPPLGKGRARVGSSSAIATFPQLHRKLDRPLTQFPPLLHPSR